MARRLATANKAPIHDEPSRGKDTASPSTEEDAATRTIFSILFSAKFLKSFMLVLLASLWAPLSQLNLSPVYGEIPAGYYHRYGLTVSFLVAFLLRGRLPLRISRFIVPFAFWIPTIQFILFKFSSTFGNPWGPVITESLTCYPLVIMSIYVATQGLEEIIGNQLGPTLAEAVPSMGVFALFTILRQTSRGFLAWVVKAGALSPRIAIQTMVASVYWMVIRESLWWPAFPSLAITMTLNPHSALSRTTEVCNSTLARHNYTLLERQESITGYISVLQDNNRGFRVMRCDHSLLGGEWISPPQKKGVVRKVAEPIYSIFVMLEAVRLVVPASNNQHKTALNIGLGIGTAPSALIHHGINTTIMELDPVVHEFALKYFNFPHIHSHYIGDAVHAVTTANTSEANSYDYIIHDVFTGGAEPAALFTVEFLSGLHMLLKPDGVIAINYAGDLAMPAASLIYRTITSVFAQCRVFREDEAPAPGAKSDDFTNMVFFCRKDPTLTVKFRKPVEADFLGSGARKEFLVPKHEIEAGEFLREGSLLKMGQTKELEKWQGKSAIGHWRVMRTVLPALVWENW